MKNTSFIILAVLIFSISAVIISCNKDDAPVPQGIPTIASALVNITPSEATVIGTLQSGGDICEWGVCWGTEPNPDTSAHKVTAPVSGKAFSAQLSGLEPMNKYYVRSYAMNVEGIGYGNQLSFVSGDREMTAEDFPDAAFRQQLLENCDLNGDGKLMASEVLNIHKLVMSNKGILSVEGVDYLRKLQMFSCCYNQLTSLKLRLPWMRDIRCFGNNLTSLDVSACPNLYCLVCKNNRLTELDLSNLSSLELLGCYNNLLTSLNMKGCKRVSSIQCSLNRLTTLELEGCEGLAELSCEQNRLTEIDVSKMEKLVFFCCDANLLTSLKVNGCSGLRTLSCNDNFLSTLDVSGCPDLFEFHCDRNPSLTTIYISAEQAARLEVLESNGSWTKPEHAVYLQIPMNTLIH